MILPCLVTPNGEHWWIEPTTAGADRECLRCGADWSGGTDLEAVIGILRAKELALSRLRTEHLSLQQEYRAAVRNGRVLAQVHAFRDWLREQPGPVEPAAVHDMLAWFLADPES